MRWLVEVSAIGKSDPQSFCVEADSWQRALQIVRSHRGEPGAMNGFSIELLEEGYRAVDPVARLRFVVKRAAEGTPLSPIEMTPAGSQPPHKNDSKAPGAVIAPAPPAPVVAAPAAPAGPAASAATAPAAPASGKIPPAAESKPKAGPPRPGNAGASGGFAASTAKAESKPEAVKPPPESLPTDAAPTVEIAKAPAPTNGASATSNGPTSNGKSVPPPKTNGPVTLEMNTNVPPQALPSQPHTEPAPTVVAPQPVGAPLPNLPPFTVLSKREQPPSPQAPLSYREYVFVVPPGTVEGTAVQILLGQLELVQGALASEKPGKLVQLAAFDETYTGKPPRPPLATLVWKDWRGEPVVSFPRKASVAPPGSKPTPSSTVPSLKPASVPPKATLLEPKTTLDDTRAIKPEKPEISFAPPDTEVTKTEVDLETAKTVETPSFQGPKVAKTMLGIPTQSFGSPSPASAAAPAATAPAAAPPAQAPAVVSAAPEAPAPSTQASRTAAPAQAPAQAAPAQAQAAQAPAQPASAPATATKSVPPPAVVTTQVVSIGASPAPVQAPVPAAAPAPAPAQAAPVAPAQGQAAKSVPPPAPAPAPQVTKSVPPPAVVPAPVTKSVPPPAAPAPAADPMAKTLPVGAQTPAPAGVLGVEKAPDFTPPPPRSATPSSMRIPAAKPGGRVSGDELIGALFEAMHDLHFLRDAIEGAEFCLQLANEAIPSRASFAHFYDMEKREYVLVRTRGRDTKDLVGKRHLEGEPLLAAAVKARRAVVRGADDAMSNRYTAVGGAKSLVVAPVFVAGRALAVLEIVNALDGAPFTQDEANAMNYIAEQFAEFLSSRGVVLDQARIQLAGG